jgi:hypothetical protein
MSLFPPSKIARASNCYTSSDDGPQLIILAVMNPLPPSLSIHSLCRIQPSQSPEDNRETAMCNSKPRALWPSPGSQSRLGIDAVLSTGFGCTYFAMVVMDDAFDLYCHMGDISSGLVSTGRSGTCPLSWPRCWCNTSHNPTILGWVETPFDALPIMRQSYMYASQAGPLVLRSSVWKSTFA